MLHCYIYLTRLSSGLMNYHQISHTIGLAGVHKHVNFMVSSVHALGPWENQLHFLWLKKNPHFSARYGFT